MDNERFIEHGAAHLFSNIAGLGVADGFTLAFTKESYDGGRADLVEVKGSIVEGKVYNISQDCYEYLFDREGVGYGTYRPTFIDLTIEGQLFKNVLTFVVVNKKQELAPPSWYAEEILRGAENFVTPNYFTKLQNKIDSLKGELV
jgi:cation transport regulator ChaC